MNVYVVLIVATGCCRVAAFANRMVGNGDYSTNQEGLVEYWKSSSKETVKLNPNDVNINVTKPIKILLHGWAGRRDAPYIKIIKDAYVERYNDDYTIVVVDYGMYVPYLGTRFSYLLAYYNLPAVAFHFAKFLCDLQESKHVDLDDVHIIGHSLGAQLAGLTAPLIKKLCKGVIGRITGLDPSGPGYEYPSCDRCRLDKSDAKFVDVIHTNRFMFGTACKNGHVDFYVNDQAIWQPGCQRPTVRSLGELIKNALNMLSSAILCSHQRSCYVFAESILSNGFLATSCSVHSENPKSCVSVDNIYMGEYCKPNNAYDAYEVKTNADYPFALGPTGPFSNGTNELTDANTAFC